MYGLEWKWNCPEEPTGVGLCAVREFGWAGWLDQVVLIGAGLWLAWMLVRILVWTWKGEVKITLTGLLILFWPGYLVWLLVQIWWIGAGAGIEP
jgi:hypothetical protein